MNHQTRRMLVLKATAKAEMVRAKCNLSPAMVADPISIAEQRGCEVRFMSLPTLEGIYSPEPKAIIVLGSDRPLGRRSFSCAHELGHHEFKHGMQVEELNASPNAQKDNNEFLVDMFAAALLMPKNGVLREIKNRFLLSEKIEAIQLFSLSSFFGVGYTSLVEHMTWTLGLLTNTKRKELLKTSPKKIKSAFGAEPGSNLILCDESWKNRAVDLDVGDTLVLPRGAIIEGDPHLEQISIIDGQVINKAKKRGYSRAYCESCNWAVNIRVCPKNYEGLARYRFLEDHEEKNQ